MKVYINPTYSQSDKTEGGIRRVVEAQERYLPDYGIDLAYSPDDADLIVNHGTLHETRSGIPMIAACHGLYWAGYNWGGWTYQANREVTENLLRADAITVPSNWVGMAISRGTWRPTTTIYHGINLEDWTVQEPRGYVLWNKARTDPVSNEKDLDRLAEMLPHVSFVTTFGQPRANVKVIGHQPMSVMRQLVGGASLYLATARETFGIGTIEALGAGVPIVGWRFGGQEEIVREDDTGYLVEPGDFEGLAGAVDKGLSNRARLSKAARTDAHMRWTWRDKVQQYAHLYLGTVERFKRKRPRVSVVITCHNLGRYINAAVGSVIDQTMSPSEWELIIVDDASTDNSLRICQQLDGYYQGRGTYSIRITSLTSNVGLSEARNIGARSALGRYLIFLDADDMLAPNALTTLADRLDRDRGVSITYGRLSTVNEQGEEISLNPWPDGNFSWKAQTAHLNQLTYASMMRYEVWQNTGGYRQRDWRAEDAGFWLRASSFGYRIACATQETTLIYRMREGSKSGVERRSHQDADGDWTAWFPWRLGASTGAEGTELVRKESGLFVAPRVPFAAQGKAPEAVRFWPVRHYQHPAVSIIIPVGPAHTEYIVDALDSVMAQTCPEWEVIVVNDSGNALSLPPWARTVRTKGGVGAGKARNLGLRTARAPLALFLDADDILSPQALEKMLAAYVTSGGYVYSDTLLLDKGSKVADAFVRDWRTLPTNETKDAPYVVLLAADWDQKDFLASGYSLERPGRHSVTALVATVDALGVGGFDEEMQALEDWEFYLRLAASGITGHRVPEPLLGYRLWSGTRRRDVKTYQAELMERMRKRYAPFVQGDKPLCACGGGGGGQVARGRAAEALGSMLPPDGTFDYVNPDPQAGQAVLAGIREVDATVRLEYIGDHYGAVGYRGPVSRQTYRAGLDPAAKFIDVHRADVDHLMKAGVFRVVTL